MSELLKKKLQEKANNEQNQQQKQTGGTVLELIQKMIPAVKKALPSHLNPERLVRIVTTEIRRNPELLSCTKESLLGALMLSAQLGLEPGPLGHCYYVPFKNKDGLKEVNFIVGYKGMIDLARRSGQISVIYAETVYENDEFEVQLGLEPKLIHIPELNGERGKPVCWYGVVKFKDGGFYIKVMSKSEIEKHRLRSPSKDSPLSPWLSDYEEMAKKTVIRAMFKYLPVSPEIMEFGIPDEGIAKARLDDEVVVDVNYEETPLLESQEKESQESNTK